MFNCNATYWYSSGGANVMPPVEGPIPLDPLSTVPCPFPNQPGDLELSTDVPFKRANNISVVIPDAAVSIALKTFNVSLLNYSDTPEPQNLYTGVVDTGCIDGLTITQADDANDVILTYNPKNPPNINIDVEIPDRPDFDIKKVTLPTNNTDISIMAKLPDLYYSMELIITSFLDDVLISLSDEEIRDLNAKVYAKPVALDLLLRGIDNTSKAKFDTLADRSENSLDRDLRIISEKANNTITAADSLAKLNQLGASAHADYQKAIIDNLELDLYLSTQNQLISILVFNAEIQYAHVAYAEYNALVEFELAKLELYNKQIISVGKALDGNSDLAKAYRKQLAVIQQVFESFEQSMELSELTIKLATAQIKVETENIKTDTMLIDGSASKSQSEAYQAKTVSMAYGMNEEAEIAKGNVDISVLRTEIAKEITEMDLALKNTLIDIDNDQLVLLAQSVSIKLESIKESFKLDNLSAYNDVYLSFLSSSVRSKLISEENQQKVYSTHRSVEAKTNAANEEPRVVLYRRRAYRDKFNALIDYLDTQRHASEIISRANTIQTINQTISGA